MSLRTEQSEVWQSVQSVKIGLKINRLLRRSYFAPSNDHLIV